MASKSRLPSLSSIQQPSALTTHAGSAALASSAVSVKGAGGGQVGGAPKRRF